jgi:hypothetical protein
MARVKTKQPKRYRLKFCFWLNVLNADEELVADEIERLKNSRSFSSVCRDGIMLVSELRQRRTDLLTRLFSWLSEPITLFRELQEGRVDMLLQLFPWVRDALMPPPDNAAMMREIDFLKQLVLAQQNGTATPHYAPQSEAPGSAKQLTNNGPKPLAGANKPVSILDDDDDDLLEVKRDENAGSRSATNFIKSAFALNGMSYDQ